MSSRSTELVPYDVPIYLEKEINSRWRGYFISLDRAVNGLQGAPATASGASPLILRNDTPCDEMVFISGGTVSVVEYSRDSTTWIPTGIISGQFTVFPGDYLRITYTVAPTINLVYK